MTKEEIAALLGGNVDTVTSGLAGLSIDDLNAVLAAEVDGSNRVTVTRAIDAAIAAAATAGAQAPEGADTAAAGSGTDTVAAAAGADTIDAPAPPAPAPAAPAPLVTWTADGELQRLAAGVAALGLPSLDGLANAPIVDQVLAHLQAYRTLYENAPERIEPDEIDVGGVVGLALPDGPLVKSVEADDPLEHPTFIAFVAAGAFVAGIAPQRLRPDQFHRSGTQAVLDRRVAIAADAPPVTIDHAVLIDEEGAIAGVCEIPGSLAAGGGRSAEFPAGSLIF